MNPAATLKDAEQMLDVRTSLVPKTGISLDLNLGVGFLPPRTPAIFGTKSPGPAIHVRDELQHWGMVLVLHARLPRINGTGVESCEYSLSGVKLFLILYVYLRRQDRGIEAQARSLNGQSRRWI